MEDYFPSPEFLDKDPYARERILREVYYPFVKADRLWGHYHILEPDLPKTGG